MNFSNLIREKRLALNKTLREFSRESGYDVGYLSRLENEIILPPEERENLEKLAKAYFIEENSEEWNNFMDSASISRNQFPENIDEKVKNFLPAFCRKASKKEVTQEDVNKLIELIKGE